MTIQEQIDQLKKEFDEKIKALEKGLTDSVESSQKLEIIKPYKYSSELCEKCGHFLKYLNHIDTYLYYCSSPYCDNRHLLILEPTRHSGDSGILRLDAILKLRDSYLKEPHKFNLAENGSFITIPTFTTGYWYLYDGRKSGGKLANVFNSYFLKTDDKNLERNKYFISEEALDEYYCNINIF